MLEDKVRDVFSDMVVLKNPERTEFFSNLSLPSYMRDWLVMKFSDDDGVIDYDSVLRYIRQYIPSREDFEQFKFEMVNGETVPVYAARSANGIHSFAYLDVKSGEADGSFSLNVEITPTSRKAIWQLTSSSPDLKTSL